MKKPLRSILAILLILLMAVPYVSASTFASETEGDPYYSINKTYIRHAGTKLYYKDLAPFIEGEYYYYAFAKKSTPNDIVDKAESEIESGEYIVYGKPWDKIGWENTKKDYFRVRLYYDFDIVIEGCEEGGLYVDGAALKSGHCTLYDDHAYKVYPVEVEGYEAVVSGAGTGSYTPSADTTITVTYIPTAVKAENASRKRASIDRNDLKSYVLDAISPTGSISGYDTVDVYYSSYTDGKYTAWDKVDEIPSDPDKHEFGLADLEKIMVIYSDSQKKLSSIGGHAEIAFDSEPSSIVASGGSIPFIVINDENGLTEEEVFDIIYNRNASVPNDLTYQSGTVSVEYQPGYSDYDYNFGSFGEWKPIKGNESIFNSTVNRKQLENGTISFRIVFEGDARYTGSTSNLVGILFTNPGRLITFPNPTSMQSYAGVESSGGEVINEAPSEETPIDEAPIEETPIEETSTEETPSEDAITSDIPEEEIIEENDAAGSVFSGGSKIIIAVCAAAVIVIAAIAAVIFRKKKKEGTK